MVCDVNKDDLSAEQVLNLPLESLGSPMRFWEGEYLEGYMVFTEIFFREDGDVTARGFYRLVGRGGWYPLDDMSFDYYEREPATWEQAKEGLES